MPRKVEWPSDYYVSAPKIDSSLEEYCHNFLIWDKTDYGALQKKAKEWLQNNLNPIIWENAYWARPNFFKCKDYFQEYNDVALPFKIFKVSNLKLWP